MKHLVYFFCFQLISLISCTSSIPEIKSLDKIDFNGHVKTIIEKSYLISFDSHTENIKVIRRARKINDDDDFVILFDQLGNIINWIYMNNQDDTTKRIIFEYNKENILHFKYEMNSNGDLTKVSEFQFDKKTKIFHETETDGNGTILNRRQYIYNKYNRIKRELCSFAIGDLSHSIDYRYDQKIRLIAIDYFLPDKLPLKKIRYNLDSQNNIMEEITISGDNFDSIRWKYEYEYDNQKNWIKRLDYYEGNPRYLIERKIEYF